MRVLCAPLSTARLPVRVCARVCSRVCARVCARVSARACVWCARAFVCLIVCVCVCVCVCVYVCMCVCMATAHNVVCAVCGFDDVDKAHWIDPLLVARNPVLSLGGNKLCTIVMCAPVVVDVICAPHWSMIRRQALLVACVVCLIGILWRLVHWISRCVVARALW